MPNPKTVLITGAAHGIGEAIARVFLRNGWKVAGTTRQKNFPSFSLEPNCKFYSLDLTQPESILGLADHVLEDFGNIDVLVNNAGLCFLGPLEELTAEEDRRIFETNVLGPMRLIRSLLPSMRMKGGGRIIMISSMCGGMTLPLYSHYCATKWAIEGFSEALAFELRQHNITIKIIQPGVFKTGSFEHQLADHRRRLEHPAYRDFWKKTLPSITAQERSAPSPEPVADAVWQAATDHSPRLRYRPRSRLTLAARAFIPTILYQRFLRRLLNAW